MQLDAVDDMGDEHMGESDRPQDRWAAWLLERRQGGDAAAREAVVQGLARWRDRVLDNARVKPGDIVLDVGCGDGLIAFAALDRVGPSGRVIFSDISQVLLDHCAARAEEMGRLGQCEFIRASADDLALIADASVDVVTTRSVLIYVVAKKVAFGEFFRVLRPGGRVSLFEPINRFAYPEPAGRFFGYDVMPVQDLAQKLLAAYALCEAPAMESMVDFDERDLLRYAERAGFPEVQIDAHFEVITYLEAAESDPERSDAALQKRSWDVFVRSSPNPLAPTLEEAMAATLTPPEVERFTSHLRPLVDSMQLVSRGEYVYLWAVKHGR
jgi:ubiquinone/menaquinone biosynthesis C-methylase UbiE